MQPAKNENNEKIDLPESNFYKPLSSEKSKNLRIQDKKMSTEEKEKQENVEKKFEKDNFLKTSFFKLELSPISSSKDIKDLQDNESPTIKNKFFNTITCFPKVNEIEKEKASLFLLQNQKQNQLFSKKIAKICNSTTGIKNCLENKFDEVNEDQKNKRINLKIKDLEYYEKKENEINAVKLDPEKKQTKLMNQKLVMFDSEYISPNINHQASNENGNFDYCNRKRNFPELKNTTDEINQRKVSTAFEEKRRNFVNYQSNDANSNNFKNLFFNDLNFCKNESDSNQRAVTAFEVCRKSVEDCNPSKNIIFPTCLIKKIDNNIIIRPNTVDSNVGMKKRFTIKDLM